MHREEEGILSFLRRKKQIEGSAVGDEPNGNVMDNNELITDTDSELDKKINGNVIPELDSMSDGKLDDEFNGNFVEESDEQPIDKESEEADGNIADEESEISDEKLDEINGNSEVV
mgnify:CR=1 FL=1